MLVTSTCVLQAYLKSTDMGDTVEQVEALIKRHDAFAKLLTAQDQKVSLLLSSLSTRLGHSSVIIAVIIESLE